MCRITGIAFKAKYFDALDAMTDALEHGGPDDRGTWSDEQIALGHRRLAINDLSPLGHQPMLSESHRFVTVFNGEIYNFPELREALTSLGHHFKGHSDTEVLLAAVEAWGIEAALQKFNGMFAFALWDRKEKKLYLARDRFGEKPLYYGIVKGAFIFASELKALKHYPDFKPGLNEEAIQLFLRYAYVPAPLSIYSDIFKLEPGHYLSIDEGLHLTKRAYWSCEEAILKAKAVPYEGSFAEATVELDHLLTKAVKKRMISDVPFGAFLSGGVDSSAIVALMQKGSNTPVKTFSIGFEDAAYNEAPFAKRVAEHLKTDHQELYVSERDLLNVIPSLPEMYDEPFGDSSQIPTYLVASLAKQKVTVALSGDAGDEVFGGYNRYFRFQRLQHLLSLPHGFRKILATTLRVLPVERKMKLKLHKLANLLTLKDSGDAYQLLISQNHDIPNHLSFTPLAGLSQLENLMFWDAISYLPGDILTKVDRASMATALETRIPFLDPAVFDFAWSLPFHYKIRGTQGKLILKELLYRYAPKPLIDRPKAGFGIPLHDWLRGPLKEWAHDLLQRAEEDQAPFLKGRTIQAIWKAHLAKKQNQGHALWNILMLQMWLIQGK